jgi:5-methylcytosine-specific restriction protein A
MTDEEYTDRVDATLSGREIQGGWSVGTRRQGVGFGDRAVLLRQHQDRGIVAAGYFTSEVYQAEHWDESGRQANYAGVSWTTWLPIEDRQPVEVLKLRVPGMTWDRLQGSGVRLPAGEAIEFDDLWAEHLREVHREIPMGPDEVPPSAVYKEGAVTRVEVNRYERDPRARARALAHHGLDCAACGFNFKAAYGPIGAGFIHVHHVVELSTLPEHYAVDPVEDLVPVCPNCHAMLHQRRPALSVAELRHQLHAQRS